MYKFQCHNESSFKKSSSKPAVCIIITCISQILAKNEKVKINFKLFAEDELDVSDFIHYLE